MLVDQLIAVRAIGYHRVEGIENSPAGKTAVMPNEFRFLDEGIVYVQ